LIDRGKIIKGWVGTSTTLITSFSFSPSFNLDTSFASFEGGGYLLSSICEIAWLWPAVAMRRDSLSVPKFSSIIYLNSM